MKPGLTKAGKKRFEVPCYKNKILDYRKGIEEDLDNVLQIANVFLNVSKGQVASKADLEKGWKNMPLEKIIEDILKHGEFQVGEKERGAEMERTKHEVVDIVASKLVDPRTKRVYTTGMIEKALDQLASQSATQQTDKAVGNDTGNVEEGTKAKELPKWTGLVAGKSAKSQALWAMKCLVAHQPIPVARMQMKLRITCPTSALKQAVRTPAKGPQSKEPANGEDKAPGTVKDIILSHIETVQSQDTAGSEWEAVGLVEPGNFKMLNEFIESHTKGRGNVEVLDMAVGVDL